MSQIKLSVNLNKIALLRNSRGENYPNLLEVAQKVLDYGAHGITVHPRSDLRHITPEDVTNLARLCNNNQAELNVEGNPLANKNNSYLGFLQIIKKVKPQQCTLVPDSATQLTSNRGWNLTEEKEYLTFAIGEIAKLNCRISIFMDVQNAHWFSELKSMGAHRVELYTQNFSKFHEALQQKNTTKQNTVAIKKQNAMWQNNKEIFTQVLTQYINAAQKAVDAGLEVNAGHGLNLSNVKTICTLPGLKELSIGHAIVCEALEKGLASVIKNYIELMNIV